MDKIQNCNVGEKIGKSIPSRECKRIFPPPLFPPSPSQIHPFMLYCIRDMHKMHIYMHSTCLPHLSAQNMEFLYIFKYNKQLQRHYVLTL
jgi:hypothetical protein